MLMACAQSDRKVKNISTFAEAYGYVKYFHPTDESYNLDWPKFGAYGAKRVENCKNDEELIKELNSIFKYIAPTAKFVIKADKVEFDNKVLIPKNVADYKHVYWQHNGVGFGMNGYDKHENPYKSNRVNRSKTIDKTSRFGNLLTSMKADELLGKEIKYEGWGRLAENSEGKGQFWIRVDKKDGKMGFFNNSADNPIVKDKWRKIEIEGVIDDNAKDITLGCFLVGKGTMYVDNIKLYYKENNKWIEVPIENSDFESQAIGTRKQKKLNWKGLGNGYDFSQQSEIKYEGNYATKIEYIGSVTVEESNKLFSHKPKFGEIIEEEISDNIICQIPLVLYGNNTETYPSVDKSELNKFKKQFNKVKNNPDDLYLRLGNIINTYNVFQHFYPYFDITDVDWNKELNTALEQSYLDKNGKDHLKTLQKFTAKLKDGHINVYGKYNDYYMPSIKWEFIEDKLIITFISDKESQVKIGDIVEEIDGISPKEYFDATKEKISAATDSYLNYVASYRTLRGEKGSTISIKVNSKTYDFKRKYTYSEINDLDIIDEHGFNFYENKSIVYLNLDIIEMDSIKKLLPVLKKSKAIICDLRGYPNGNHEFLSYLLKEDDKDTAWMQIPQIIYPNYKNLCGFQNAGWELKVKKPYLGDKQIIFITDGQAISYAESYLGFVEGYKLGTIIGQPTAGTNGNINPFSLIGGYTISWTGMKVVKHDGSQHHGIGIIPDIILEKTIKGVAEGRDEFLDKALEMAK